MSRSPNRTTVAIASLAVLLAACGTIRQAERIEFPEQEGWISHTRAELVASFGDPSSIERDPDGREVFVYTEMKRIPSPVNPDFHGGFANPNLFGGRSPSDARRVFGSPQSLTPPPAGIDERALGAFSLDGEGRIVRVWFSERMWRRGIPAPPRRPSAEFND